MVSYNFIAGIELEQKNYGKAKELYEKSLELTRQRAEETKTALAYDDLANCYINLSFIGGSSARMYKERAYSIWKNLAKAYPQDRNFARRRDIAYEMLMNK